MLVVLQMSADDQNSEIIVQFGEAIFTGYLIEDLLELHLRECAHFKINGFQRKPQKRRTLDDLIKELRLVYPEKPNFPEALDKIRLIRNKLAHALIDQMGSDLLAEEGRDQIHALLAKTIHLERMYLKCLQDQHETLLKHIMTERWMEAVDRDDVKFDARVSTSEIQCLLDELERLNTG